jgi:hypothetical protein
MATGWQPYSIKVGKTWYSYGRLEPFGTALGTVADAVELADSASDSEASALWRKAALGFAKNITSKTFLSGLSGAIDALQDPERYGDNLIGQLAGSVVPAGVAGLARAKDETVRDTKTVEATVKGRLPGVRETVMPKRDVFGQPIAATGNFWSRFLSPVDVSPPRGGPIERMIVELGSDIAPLRDQVTVPGPIVDKTVKLTPEQYDRLQVLAGEGVKQMLSKFEEKYPRIQTMPKPTQLRLVRDLVNEGRDIGKERFIGEAGMKNLIAQGKDKKL